MYQYLLLHHPLHLYLLYYKIMYLLIMQRIGFRYKRIVKMCTNNTGMCKDDSNWQWINHLIRTKLWCNDRGI
eukprot:UN06820